MKPHLAQFESKNLIKVVNINVDQKSTPDYKKYISYKTERGIPFTVILNPKGEVVYKALGGVDSATLTRETVKHVRK